LAGIQPRIAHALAGTTIESVSHGAAAFENSPDDEENEMNGQIEKADQFRALHIPGKPLVLFNIWDAGSARTVVAAGAKAIATGSWSVAHANGYEDGEQTPLGLSIDNLRRIVFATQLPVSIDLEGGYGATADKVGSTVRLAIEGGAVGCNLEDSIPGSGELRILVDQAGRIQSARRTAEDAKIHFFINARTDVFFQQPANRHDHAMILKAVERAHAYAEAGADGLFVPGLTNLALIARLVETSPLPINIMMVDFTSPLSAFAEQGVARISHGPRPYLLAMKVLEEAAREASLEC
jgi:2-methylisocitrate lyase-like PEP mutase family enzyme